MDGEGGSRAPDAGHLEDLISLIAEGKNNVQWPFATFMKMFGGPEMIGERLYSYIPVQACVR